MSAAALLTNADLQKRTILVVEDEVLVRLMIADELRLSGFGVIEAANADEALTIVESGVPVDLVFTDIRMPGELDGYGLLRKLRESHPHIVLTVTSAHVSPSAIAASADAFFDKPYDVDRVVARLKHLLNEKEQ